jgi:hypothetical protein
VKVGVAGGSGTVGRCVVGALTAAGHEPVVPDVSDVVTASRSTAEGFVGAAASPDRTPVPA